MENQEVRAVETQKTNNDDWKTWDERAHKIYLKRVQARKALDEVDVEAQLVQALKLLEEAEAEAAQLNAEREKALAERHLRFFYDSAAHVWAYAPVELKELFKATYNTCCPYVLDGRTFLCKCNDTAYNVDDRCCSRMIKFGMCQC